MRRLDTLIPVAEGAAGRVYRARDAETGETVAVKQLRDPNPVQLERLRREAEAQRRLSHPNICRIHGLQQNEAGDWQLVMEYVSGSTLDAELDGLSLEVGIAILALVSDAVGAAHAAGVVHRDLKPGNILLRPGTAGWDPLVADFGLARSDDDLAMTATGDVLGTPAYMAPEQARGDRSMIGPPTDVFALGCMLYECLVGETPFAAATVSATLDRLLHEDAVHPRRRNPHAPEPLSRVALQCLETDPARRYPDAAALAAELVAWLEGRPVRARSFSWPYRTLRRLRRHPVTTAAASAGFATMLGLAGWLVLASMGASARERASAELAQTVADVQARMSVARLAPAHDIGRDRAALRKELVELAGSANDVSAIADLVHGALGAAYLEIGDPETAEHHARAALERRDDPRHHALRAEALLALHARAIEPAMDLPPEERTERMDAARESYLAPARAHLARIPDDGPRPALALARIAILQGNFEGAEVQLGRLPAPGPGDYRTALLAAELILARGEAALVAGNEEAARPAFAEARERFAALAVVGRSDPAPRLGSCRASRGIVRARMAFGGEFATDLRALDEGCATLSEIDGGAVASHVAQASALAVLAAAFDGVNDRDRARSLVRDGLAAAERALAIDAAHRPALEVMARLSHRLAGLEPEPAELGQAHYERALEAASRFEAAEPDDPSGPLLVGQIERDRGRHLSNYGRDPAPAVTAAAEALDRALALDPDSAPALSAAALNAVFRFYDLRAGDPASALIWADRAIALQSRVIEQDPDDVDARYDQGANLGDLWFFLSVFEDVAPGRDRAALKQEALSFLAGVRELAPKRPIGYTQAMMIELSHADLLAERHADPRAPAAAAERLHDAAVAAGVKLERGLLGWLRITQIRADLAFDEARPRFDSAWAALDEAAADESDRFYLRLYRLELGGLQARWLRENGQSGAGHALDRAGEAFDQLVASDRGSPGVLCGGARIMLERGLGSDEATDMLETARSLFSECLALDATFETAFAEDLALLAAAEAGAP